MSTATDGVASWWAAAWEKGAAAGQSGAESGVAQQIVVSLKSVGHRQLSFTHTRVAFNRDRRHYTPAFLPRSHHTSPTDERFFFAGFQQHIAQTKPLSGVLNIPKPLSTRCHVCQESFSDYLKHITHSVHISNLRKSSLNTYFNDLQEVLKRQGVTNGEPRKRRKVDEDVVREEKEESLTMDGSEGEQESPLFQQFSQF